MDNVKQILCSSKAFAAENWKYAAALGLGSVTSIIASYTIAKSLTGYTSLQFMTNIFMLSQQAEVSTIERYESLPNATTRPSNELIAWDAFSRQQRAKGNKSKSTANGQQLVKEIRDGMKIFVDAFQIIPSFMKPPQQHVINKDKNLHGFELLYPGASRENGVIIYIHGGAFVGGHCENGYPMLCMMMQYLGYASFAIDYRVAPQCSIPQMVQDCVEGYQYVVNKLKVSPKNIILIGESAGATLILLLLQALKSKEYGIELPQCAVLLSVLADLELNTLPSITTNADADCMTNVHDLRTFCKLGLDANDRSLKDCKYSPLYAEKWTGLCPLYFCSGATEILLSDAQECVKKCQESGVEVASEWHASLPHGVAAWCAWLPEARESMLRIIDWIQIMQRKQM